MHVHATHVFANLMYFLSDALGFWPKGRKSEMRYRTKYDSHRKHFAEYGVEEVTLNKLTAYLHTGITLPPLMINNHIDILESLCNTVLRTPLMPNLRSNEYMTQIYIRSALIPILCADIAIFQSDSSKESIYYHLDHWLKLDGLLKESENEPKVINKLFAKKHLQEYIETHFNLSEMFVIKPITDYLDLLAKKGNQTATTVRQRTAECVSTIEKHHSLQEKFDNNEEKISNSSIELDHTLKSRVQELSAMYIAFTILQYIQAQIGLIDIFHHTYNAMCSNVQSHLSIIKESLTAALGEDYTKRGALEQQLSLIDSKASRKLTIEKKKYITRLILEDMIPLFHQEFPSLSPSEYQLMTQAHKESQVLSKMVSLPPNSATGILNEQLNASEYSDDGEIVVPAFKNEYYKVIYNFAHSRDSLLQWHYDPISFTVFILSLLQCGKPNSALQAIKKAPREKLPLFGFVKHSLAVIRVGLTYKLEKEKIKHESLTEQVNDIINHQGVISLLAPRPYHLFDENSWLGEKQYLRYSLVSGNNTYAATVIQAIYAYNYTVAKITTRNDMIFSDDNPPYIDRVNIKDINYQTPLIVHGLLNELNNISGKLLASLEKTKRLNTPSDFMKCILDEDILTRSDLERNLIHCIDGSTLAVCLLDYLTLIMFLSPKGDDVSNIIKLGENHKVVELLFKSSTAKTC
ncbi:MAG: hypothetical protein ACRC0J_05970 [Shewanella oncorhynchi]